MKHNFTKTIKTLTAAVALASTGSVLALQSDVSSGTSHTLFIGDNGSVYCSGALSSGVCLDGGEGADPVVVEAARDAHVTRSGALYSTYTPRYIGLDNAITVDAALYKSAVLTDDGTVYWFGYDSSNNSRNFTPTDIPSLAGATDISIRGNVTNYLYAVKDGKAYVYDFATQQVDLIYGITGTVVSVDADETHALFRTADGTLFASGDNESGQLGSGDYNSTNLNNAVPVVDDSGNPLTNVTTYSVGHGLSMAVVDGVAFSWGINRNGALGLGSMDPAITREYAGVIANYTRTATNVSTNGATLIQGSDGSLSAMGFHNFGIQLQDANPRVLIESGVSDLYVNNGDTWFVKVDGTLQAWGGGNNGQMAAGSSEELGVYSLETHALLSAKDFVGGPAVSQVCSIEYIDVEVPGPTVYVDVVGPTVYVDVEVEVPGPTVYVDVVGPTVYVERDLSSMTYTELKMLIKSAKEAKKLVKKAARAAKKAAKKAARVAKKAARVAKKAMKKSKRGHGYGDKNHDHKHKKS